MNNPILPDGSSCFTAEIMSREEAIKLPLNKRPLNYRISSEMYMAVWGAIGEATLCWSAAHPPSVVVDYERASEIVVRLCFKIAEELEKQSPTPPLLDNPAPEPPPATSNQATPTPPA